LGLGLAVHVGELVVGIVGYVLAVGVVEVLLHDVGLVVEVLRVAFEHAVVGRVYDAQLRALALRVVHLDAQLHVHLPPMLARRILIAALVAHGW